MTPATLCKLIEEAAKRPGNARVLEAAERPTLMTIKLRLIDGKLPEVRFGVEAAD